MALRDYLMFVFAVAGYFVGAVLWKYIFSLGLVQFVFGFGILGAALAISAYLRKWSIVAFFVAAIVAQMTATYWYW